MTGVAVDIPSILFALAVILTAAKLGGDIAVRLGQPAVLGELFAGVLLGNAHRWGLPWFSGFAADPSLDLLAQLGVILLVFRVGLESTVRGMLAVGLVAGRVALMGVAASFALGTIVATLMLPSQSVYAHAFLGATLAATSVGVTARVLNDLGQSRSTEARIVLGAAVLDDVLSLLVLSIVSGIIRTAEAGGPISVGAQVGILLKAVVFLGGALGLGVLYSRYLFKAAERLRGRDVLLATGLALCFTLAYLAAMIGLAPIVGAYAAGLILEDTTVEPAGAPARPRLDDLIDPVAGMLVPVFFVIMGMRVDLGVFGNTAIIGLALALTLAAVLGKLACAFAAPRGVRRLVVGAGMIPRGEVQLIFAGIGLTLTYAGRRIMDPGVYSAIVILVILTTMVTPPLLKWTIARSGVPSPQSGC